MGHSNKGPACNHRQAFHGQKPYFRLLFEWLWYASPDRILAIELKRFGEACPKAFKKLFPITFLAVDTGHFLDPSDPPVTILLGHCRVRIGHSQSPHKEAYYISLFLSTRSVPHPATEDIAESAHYLQSELKVVLGGLAQSARASVTSSGGGPMGAVKSKPLHSLTPSRNHTAKGS